MSNFAVLPDILHLVPTFLLKLAFPILGNSLYTMWSYRFWTCLNSLLLMILLRMTICVRYCIKNRTVPFWPHSTRSVWSSWPVFHQASCVWGCNLVFAHSSGLDVWLHYFFLLLLPGTALGCPIVFCGPKWILSILGLLFTLCRFLPFAPTVLYSTNCSVSAGGG